MRPFDLVTSKLECLPCRALPGERRAIARCPAHSDNHPSLDIRELTDERVLIKCRAGCGAIEIVESVGITLADLYPRRLRIAPAGRRGRPTSKANPMRRVVTPTEVVTAAWHVYTCARLLRDGIELNDIALEALAQIVATLDLNEVTVDGGTQHE